MDDIDECFADGVFGIDANDLLALLAGDLVLTEVIEGFAKDFVSAFVVAIDLSGADGVLSGLLVVFPLELDGTQDKVCVDVVRIVEQQSDEVFACVFEVAGIKISKREVVACVVKGGFDL